MSKRPRADSTAQGGGWIKRHCAPPADGDPPHRSATDAAAGTNAAAWRTVRAPFLFPCAYPGHTCEWEPFSYTQAGCLLCGAEHHCDIDNPKCQAVHHEEGHVVCEITGCVLRDTTLYDEWHVSDRTCFEAAHTKNTADAAAAQSTEGISASSRAHGPCAGITQASGPSSARVPALPAAPPAGQAEDPCAIWNFVHRTVTHILQSDDTVACMRLELQRLMQTQVSALQRELRRQLAERGHVNLVDAGTAVTWATRKVRRPVILETASLEALVHLCTDAVTEVVLKYGTHTPFRLFQNDTRRREFACSMLYLMRSGVECRGQCILPKLEIMQDVLPLETCLPDTFGIRAKSITEGENLLKLEIRRMRAQKPHSHHGH